METIATKHQVDRFFDFIESVPGLQVQISNYRQGKNRLFELQIYSGAALEKKVTQPTFLAAMNTAVEWVKEKFGERYGINYRLLDDTERAVKYHIDSIVGLWVTDRPDLVEDPQKVLFQLQNPYPTK